MAFFGLDKWARLARIIKQEGGPFKAMYKLWRTDTLKEGTLVGWDAYGNRYYENNYYMIARNRWVDYNIACRWDYDATMVPPEWYGWLHHKTDYLPCEDPAKVEIANCGWYSGWMLPHKENWSGSVWQYYPYSTTRQAVQVWDGSATCDRCAGFGPPTSC